MSSMVASSAQRRHSNRSSKMRRVSTVGLFLGAFVFGYSLMTQLLSLDFFGKVDDLRALSEDLSQGPAASAAEPPHRRTEHEYHRTVRRPPFAATYEHHTRRSSCGSTTCPKFWRPRSSPPTTRGTSSSRSRRPSWNASRGASTTRSKRCRGWTVDSDNNSDNNRMGRLVAKFERRWAYLRRQQQQQPTQPSRRRCTTSRHHHRPRRQRHGGRQLRDWNIEAAPGALRVALQVAAIFGQPNRHGGCHPGPDAGGRGHQLGHRTSRARVRSGAGFW